MIQRDLIAWESMILTVVARLFVVLLKGLSRYRKGIWRKKELKKCQPIQNVSTYFLADEWAPVAAVDFDKALTDVWVVKTPALDQK